MTTSPSSAPLAAIEAVIFDLDGVLADTEPVHLEASRRVVAPAEMPMDEYLRFVGGGWEPYVEWIESRFGIPGAEFDGRYTDAIVTALQEGPSPAMRGADALVKAVLRRDLRVAVASMSKRAWVQATMAAIGLDDLISVVVTLEDAEHAKPHPDIYLRTAALLGVEPAHCLAVEDSVHGVASAAAAGMWVVQTRQASIHADPQPAAHAVIQSFAEFDLGWLEGRPLSPAG